jgi:hypothetical protein
MRKQLSSRVRGCSLALAALCLAAVLPLSASAQCFGPYASFPAAQNACRTFLNSGFCATDPRDGAFVEIVGYTTPDGWPAVACCCQALVAFEIPPTEEAVEPDADSESESAEEISPPAE